MLSPAKLPPQPPVTPNFPHAVAELLRPRQRDKLLSSAAAQARCSCCRYPATSTRLDAGWSTCASGDYNPISPNFTPRAAASATA